MQQHNIIIQRKRLIKLIQIRKIKKSLSLNHIFIEKAKKCYKNRKRKLRKSILMLKKYKEIFKSIWIDAKKIYKKRKRSLEFKKKKNRLTEDDKQYIARHQLLEKYLAPFLKEKPRKKIKKQMKRFFKEKTRIRMSYSFIYLKLLRKFMKCGKLENIRRKIQEAVSMFCLISRITFEEFTRLFFLLAFKLTLNVGFTPERRGRKMILKKEVGTERRGLIIGLDIFLQGVFQRRKRRKYLSFEYFFFHELKLGIGRRGIKNMKSGEIVGDYFRKLISIYPKKKKKFRYGKAFSKAARMLAAATIQQAF